MRSRTALSAAAVFLTPSERNKMTEVLLRSVKLWPSRYQVQEGGGRKQRGTLPARLEGPRSMKKSRLVDKTKRLSLALWTPAGVAPEGAASEPRTNTLPRQTGKVKPAGHKKARQGQGRADPPRGPLDSALTAAGQWESGGGGAHTIRVDPG